MTEKKEKLDQNIESIDSKEKAEILKKLVEMKSTVKRVKLFWEIMDEFWVDVVAGLIPWLWDAWSSKAASLYLLAEWKRLWLSTKDSLKILGYQTTDALVWTIPIIWDISDYFFKANKWSAKLFEKHFEKLQKEAINKWISQKEIDDMISNKNKLITLMASVNKE